MELWAPYDSLTGSRGAHRPVAAKWITSSRNLTNWYQKLPCLKGVTLSKTIILGIHVGFREYIYELVGGFIQKL